MRKLYVFIFLFKRQSYREIGRNRDDFQSLFPPRQPQHPGLGQATTSNQEYHPGLHMGDPPSRALCPLGCISTVQEGKRSSWDLSKCSYGMLSSQVVVNGYRLTFTCSASLENPVLTTRLLVKANNRFLKTDYQKEHSRQKEQKNESNRLETW